MSEEAAPKSKKKLPLIIGGVVALLAAVGGGLYATGMVGGGGEAHGEAAAEGEHGEAKAEEGHGEAKAEEGHGEAKAAEGGHGEAKAAEGGHGETKSSHVSAEGASAVGNSMSGGGSQITNLGAFTVNLRGSGGGRVLRMEVQLDSEEDVASLLSARAPQLRDSIITAVSDYTWAELEGVDGKTRLRDELLTRLNGVTSPKVIDRLYFTQFVVQ
jgi:flagellar protein FliL